MARGPGQVVFGMARRIKMDNRGESGEQRKVEHASSTLVEWVVGRGRDGFGTVESKEEALAKV